MPSPQNARKDTSKKTPQKTEGKDLDLGQKLSQKKSQDFKSRIELWNIAGADNEAEPAVEEEQQPQPRPRQKKRKSDANTPTKEHVAKTPATKSPEGLGVAVAIEGLHRKVSREVDTGRKAWVRKRSRTQPTSQQVKVDTSPGLLKKTPPPAKPKAAPETSDNEPDIGNDEGAPTVKRAVTPKRRVVSDEHWRKDRTQQKNAEAKQEIKQETKRDITPKVKVVRRSVASVGLKVPPSSQEFRDIPEPSPALRRRLGRHDRSRSTSRERDDVRATTPDYESSGTKVYIKRRRRSKPADERTRDRVGVNHSETSLTAPSSIDRPSSETDITTPDITARAQGFRSSTDPYIKSRRFLSTQPARPPPEDTDRQRSAHRTRRPLAAQEANGRDDMCKSSDMPKGDDEPVQLEPKVFGNRIQGWLAGMPDDPFTDSTLSQNPLETSGITFAALNHHNMRSKDDVGLNQDHEQTMRLAPKAEEIDEYEILATSNSLRRNGARRSSRHDSSGRERKTTRSRERLDTMPVEPPRRLSQRNVPDRPRDPRAGNRLSTIASVSTLREQGPNNPDESVLSRASDGNEPARYGTVIRNRRTKHSDLMSVLSLPRDDDRALAPARSIRTRRPRHDLMTTQDLMNEVTTDELKYQRELRTLVDGVIPVLLQYVLAQNGQTGSGRGFAKGEAALTQPIVEMGVALERLKGCHKRIPMHDPNELLLWADNTAKIYAAYINVWRLGFNDVVVNLAPAEQKRQNGPAAWDDGLQRNEHGDLLDGDGERVDVAYLLKRPLIRIKDLGKSLKGISQIRPSLLADKVLDTYEDLVLKAKQRTNDERARIEDETASAIDPTRARDPRTLMPLNAVSIDPDRHVRARDFFDLQFFHSSGQQIDCKIEIIVRDDPPERQEVAGDMLICEISPAGRWLLFPPLLTSSVSCRLGDKEGELVVMVRGRAFEGTEWRELFSLQSSQEQSEEWIEMLGSNPPPPRLTRRSSFNTMRGPRVQFASGLAAFESDLPIGERARSNAPRWDGSEVNSVSDTLSHSSPTDLNPPLMNGLHSAPPRRSRVPGSNASFVIDGQRSILPEGPRSPLAAAHRHARSASDWIPRIDAGSRKAYGDLSPAMDYESGANGGGQPQRRPTLERRTSSVPSMDLPTVHKLRRLFKSGPEPEPQSERQLQTTTPRSLPLRTDATDQEPISAPAKLQKRSPPAANNANGRQDSRADRTTPVRSTGLGSIPSFTPAFLQRPRRSSSPLKHEYEPSTASELSESDFSDAADDDSITSESSAEEAVSTLGELRDFSKFAPVRKHTQPQSARSLDTTDADTIRPSESASLGPYRSIPTNAYNSAKSVACLFSWSDQGAWQSIHPEECQIIVTPGLIEAFDLAQANAVAVKAGSAEAPSPSTRGVKPLVALELTPWVPLRRGTAVDISIRSPPTTNSVLRNGNNIMFRSRSPEECENLYNLINRARIDNPTWMALQNARDPVSTSNWGEAMDRRNAARADTANSSWLKSLSRKGSTYRSKGTRSASVAGSQSSVGTMNSAFTAIRQFSGSSKIFNIAKSTVRSKHSTRSSHSDSLSSGIATPLPVDTSLGTPVGITNTKIRLYVRESTSKWRDLGNAKLTVMLPPRPNDGGPADPRTTGLEKRILITGKKDSVVLDVTLEENCFERVARTGIAVSVWEEEIGPNGEVGYAAATGGVLSSRSTVYMLQMKSEREAAYTFSMVGKLRY